MAFNVLVLFFSITELVTEIQSRFYVAVRPGAAKSMTFATPREFEEGLDDVKAATARLHTLSSFEHNNGQGVITREYDRYPISPHWCLDITHFAMSKCPQIPLAIAMTA